MFFQNASSYCSLNVGIELEINTLLDIASVSNCPVSLMHFIFSLRPVFTVISSFKVSHHSSLKILFIVSFITVQVIYKNTALCIVLQCSCVTNQGKNTDLPENWE